MFFIGLSLDSSNSFRSLSYEIFVAITAIVRTAQGCKEKSSDNKRRAKSISATE